MNYKHKILASVLAISTVLSLCGCNTNSSSSQTSSIVESNTITSEDIYSDINYMKSIKNVANANMNISFALNDTFSIEASLNAKGTENASQIQLNNAKLVIKNTADEEPTVLNLSDVTLIFGNDTMYISEDSFKNIMKLTGQEITYDNEADWISVSMSDIENNTSFTFPTGLTDSNTLYTFMNDTVIPEFSDAFESIKYSFVNEDKHSITLDKAAVVTICDKLITMCDDGSLLKIYNDALNKNIINTINSTNNSTEFTENANDSDTTSVETKPEDVIANLKESIVSIQKKLSNETDTSQGAITVETSVTGVENNITANYKVTMNAVVPQTDKTNSIANGVISMSITEGIANVDVPTNVISMDDYQTAFIESVNSDTSISTAISTTFDESEIHNN